MSPAIVWQRRAAAHGTHAKLSLSFGLHLRRSGIITDGIRVRLFRFLCVCPDNNLSKAVIFIRKTFAAALSLLTALSLSGCGITPPPQNPVFDISGKECVIEYAGKEYHAGITNAPGITSVSFEDPPSVAGFVYTFKPDECNITFGDLTFSAAPSRLCSNALPQLINDILKDAASPEALTPESAPASEQAQAARWSGSVSGVRYTVDSDRITGEILTVVIKDRDTRIIFSDKE